MSLVISSGITRPWRSSNFDSELYVNRVGPNRHADLIIDVSVFFQRIEPPDTLTDSLGNSQTVLSWGSEANWQRWVNRCKNTIERRFSDKLWLVPGGDWGVRFEEPGRYYRPGIKCGLRIRPVRRRDRRHLQLNGYRVPQSFCPSTPSQVNTNAIYMSYMQGNYGRIVSTDADSCLTHPTEGHRQEVAAHEFGHFLGMPHVAASHPLCPPSNRNARACYGVTAHQRGDIEGFGNRVEAWHAFPWVRRLTRHLNQSVPWTVTVRRPRPVQAAAPPSPGRMDAGLSGSMDAGVIRDGGVPSGV